MKRERKDEYAEALDQLEAQHQAGSLTQGEYDVKRARLLAEASVPAPTNGATLLRVLGFLIVLFVVIRIVVYVIGSLS